GLPYIGRVHDVPSQTSWLKFFEWSKQYGPIYQMKIFGTVHVWISSETVARDLLSKRSKIYSDRPMIPNLPDNRTSGTYLALLGRTAAWFRQRKLCNFLMHASSSASLHSYPTFERDRFLYLFCLWPDQYVEWIEQLTSRTVSRLCWGTAQPGQVLRYTTMGLLETISPSGSLPNIFNFLRHLPVSLSPWKKKERGRRALEMKLFAANLQFVENSLRGGRAEPSFIRTFFETKKHPDERVRERWGELPEAVNVVGLMAIAGALTIGSPLQSYMLAMLHHPEWQSRLQAEIDAVCGGRCPCWEDRERLPLLRAVVKEVIRWRPPVPTGIPHATEADDIYNGYFIPAGATIHALEWGITRDEAKYPDPETFNPARWLDPSFPSFRAPLTRYPNLSGFSQFGFGRRTCQGIPIVEQDLFLAMGGLAWGFTIYKKRDPQFAGRELPVHWNDYTPLLIAKPATFPFEAVPRSWEKVRRMRDMYLASLVQTRLSKDMDMSAFKLELGDRAYCDDDDVVLRWQEDAREGRDTSNGEGVERKQECVYVWGTEGPTKDRGSEGVKEIEEGAQVQKG
ncbi:cytochrome P450, partial [Corynascus similis CBS 632.67]